MRIALVHYHLAPGGVTRVIESASLALTAAGIRHVILSSSPPENLDPALRPLAVQFPVLGYLDSAALPPLDSFIASLRQAASDALGAPPDIWHFHNHSLGKNKFIGLAIAHLAEIGQRLVLQIHDLAEDGRSENYHFIAACPQLYPSGPTIHYCFINSRDREIFTHAGLPSEQSSLLINPIPIPPRPSTASPSDSALVFAPIRAIRRKNIGELILLAALAPAGTRFAISRAPLNPDALPIYENWRNFATKHQLPVQFAVVNSDFQSWVDRCTHFVSTSVAEGFGLPFLESIAHAKPLFGRDLPHLTADHARHGIFNPSLYQKILIPLSWINRTILKTHLLTTLERNHNLYQSPLPANYISRILSTIIENDHVDFGNLPEFLQQSIIEKLITPPYPDPPKVHIGNHIFPLPQWLESVLSLRHPAASIESLTPYSLTEYQLAITSIYHRLATSTPAPIRHLPPEKILNAYLQPAQFHFLRSAPLKFRAAIFDIYGTLLIAPSGGIKPDPAIDPILADILRKFGHSPPPSPSGELYQAMRHHHATAGVPYPEVDLCKLWQQVLGLAESDAIFPLIHALEERWHPTHPMPGAAQAIQKLHHSGIALGLLSNAQCNTLGSLGQIADIFAPELTILSYQHGIAKPSPALFQTLTDRLAARKISPGETLYIGNDPLQDILPAATAGFRTALFTGHPQSHRAGQCTPDYSFNSWSDLTALF